MSADSLVPLGPGDLVGDTTASILRRSLDVIHDDGMEEDPETLRDLVHGLLMVIDQMEWHSLPSLRPKAATGE